jgi:hypothetical protein
VAQENYTHWLTEEDGLPTKAIEDIDQDENGNIILGSYLGLTIYDGKNFTTKTIKDGLPNTSVGSIIKDSWGNLWIRSYSNKLSTYKDGKIAPIKSYNKDIYRLKGYGIYFISDSEMIADYVLPFKSITHKKRNGKWIKTREFFSTELRVPMRNPNNRKEVIGFFDYELYSKSKLIFSNSKIKRNTKLNPKILIIYLLPLVVRTANLFRLIIIFLNLVKEALSIMKYLMMLLFIFTKELIILCG